MIIFMDTNVLFDEYGQKTFLFGVLMRFATAQGHRMILPEIIYREAERLYYERIDGYNEDVRRLFDPARPSELPPVEVGLLEFDKIDMLKSFREGLFGYGGSGHPRFEMQPFKLEQREQAIKRVLANRMPMKRPLSDGKLPKTVNARDALAWLSILEVVRETKETEGNYVFIGSDPDYRVSKNPKDPMHADLRKDLEDLGVEERCFRFFTNLGDFLSDFGPDLQRLDREIIDLRNEIRLLRDQEIVHLQGRSRLHEERMHLLWRRRLYMMRPQLLDMPEEERRALSELIATIEAEIGERLPALDREIDQSVT